MKRFKKDDIVYCFCFDPFKNIHVLKKGKIISPVQTIYDKYKEIKVSIKNTYFKFLFGIQDTTYGVEIENCIITKWQFDLFKSVKEAKKKMLKKQKDSYYRSINYSLGEFEGYENKI